MLSHKLKVTVTALFLVAVAERAASAAVCTAIDTTRDTLSEPDRNATRILLGQALRQQGIEVADQNCLGTYVVYHVKLGNSITVFMQGPQGYREGSARAIEEIPAVADPFGGSYFVESLTDRMKTVMLLPSLT